MYCPYCKKQIKLLSQDHIFSNFLGGQKKIDCCKSCNDFFGHSFEAYTAKNLRALQIIISSWGVPLKTINSDWKGAYTKDGANYNLSVDERGLVSKLSKPVIEFHEDGRLKQAVFPDKKQAEKAVRGLIEKGKAHKDISIEKLPREKNTIPNLNLPLEIGGSLRRLALKMCIALSTLMPDFDLDEVAEARLFLMGNPDSVPVNNVFVSFDIFDEIDSRRNALSHVIYIERGATQVYGFVQFFGAIQFYCRVGIYPPNSSNYAMFATLDTITGEESFSSIPPLNLPHPPFFRSTGELSQLAETWVIKLKEEAKKRGGNPVDFRMTSMSY